MIARVKIISLPEEDDGAIARLRQPGGLRTAPPPQPWARNYAAARGLYRIFNAAGYRFCRKLGSPPAETDTPFATNASLPYQPANTFGDGTWYLSMSYFDGCLDSGFYPIGPHGETYVTMEISGGVAVGTRPSAPSGAHLEALPANVVRVTAFYLRTQDGANAATEWTIAYSTDGSTPPSNNPSIVVPMGTGPMQILSYSLPAAPPGATVKVELQTRRSPASVYCLPTPVLSILDSTTNPAPPVDLQAWPGQLPEGF